MLERSIRLEIEKGYSELRTILLEKGGRIVSEDPPKHISIQHGSLRGVSPKGAKKVVSFQFFPNKSGTRIISFSSISSDWANLTLWGNIVAGIVAAVFWWIATDMENFVANGISGYWTGLARVFGYPNVQYVFFMINVIKALSIVLVVTIVLEVLDVFIVKSKINSFAEETLDELAEK
jgi:hypothetical protein